MNPFIQLKKTTPLFLVALGVACFGLSPSMQAVIPAPDGGYPGGNTAEGQAALLSLTTGGFNTAVGLFSLRSDTTGQLNTAVGAGTLLANTANENTATGAGALLNTTGPFNTANGAFALFENTTGSFNTAVGLNALFNNTTGSGNISVGHNTGDFVTTANNVICIGESVSGANVSNTCFIGNIFGQTSFNGIPVFINSLNQLGTATSSRRFKEDIKQMDRASEVVYALNPVTFHYKTDTNETPQFGLIAEEVAKVNPALVLPDKEGKPYTVRYDAVNAMLLNEFLKARRQIDAQQKQIEALAAVVQKVSAQLELSKPAPQTVLNNR